MPYYNFSAQSLYCGLYVSRYVYVYVCFFLSLYITLSSVLSIISLLFSFTLFPFFPIVIIYSSSILSFLTYIWSSWLFSRQLFIIVHKLFWYFSLNLSLPLLVEVHGPHWAPLMSRIQVWLFRTSRFCLPHTVSPSVHVLWPHQSVCLCKRGLPQMQTLVRLSHLHWCSDVR